MEEEKRKSRRGGRRDGSGRPRKNNGVLYARMSVEAIAVIKAQAEAAGQTVGEFIERRLVVERSE